METAVENPPSSDEVCNNSGHLSLRVFSPIQIKDVSTLSVNEFEKQLAGDFNLDNNSNDKNKSDLSGDGVFQINDISSISVNEFEMLMASELNLTTYSDISDDENRTNMIPTVINEMVSPISDSITIPSSSQKIKVEKDKSDSLTEIDNFKCQQDSNLGNIVNINEPDMKQHINQNLEHNLHPNDKVCSNNNENFLEQHNDTESHDHYTVFKPEDLHYIENCVIRWSSRFPWIKFDSSTGIIYCSSCNAVQFASTITHLHSKEDVFVVSRLLLQHSQQKSHFLHPLLSNEYIFYGIYKILKYNTVHYPNLADVFAAMNNVFVKYLNITMDETFLRIVISTFAEEINVYIKSNILASKTNKVSYVVDPCNKILIARIINSKYEAEEHILCEYFKSPLDFSSYIAKELNISDDHMVFMNYRVVCGKCNICENIRNLNVYNEMTLPPRFPCRNQLLWHILRDPFVKKYCLFLNKLCYLYTKYKTHFSNISGIEILDHMDWKSLKLYDYLTKYTYSLLLGIRRVIGSPDSSIAEECISTFPVANEYFRKVLEILEVLRYNGYSYLDSKMVHLNKQFDYIEKNNFGSLQIVHWVLSTFYEEICKKGYQNGAKYVKDFHFLFSVRKLANASPEDPVLIRIFNLLKDHLQANFYEFVTKLKEFGNYLECMKIPDLEITNFLRSQSTLMQCRFALVLNLYHLVKVLPCMNTTLRRSFYEARLILTEYKSKYKNLYLDLFTIYMESPNHSTLLSLMTTNDLKYN